jgi:hypothetical protein
MGALAPNDRVRLTRLLGMLGSDHDGERANAGALAHRLIQQNGLQWNDVIVTPRGQKRDKPPINPDLNTAWHWIDQCSPWEQDFIRSVTRRNTLSPKQQAVVTRIAEALRARGFE